MNCEMVPVGEQAFRWDATIRTLPGVSIANLVSTPYDMKRNGGHVADGDDSFILGIVRHGGFLARQGGQETFVTGHDAVLWSNEQTGTGSFQAGTDRIMVTIPRRVLVPVTSRVDTMVMSLVPGNSEALRLLSGYASMLLADTAAMSPALQALNATYVQDLVAMVLGATRDATEIAKGRGVRIARLKAIKADIDANLISRDLSLESLARRNGISVRYVRELFNDDGTSFTDYVLKMRLLRAYGVLCRPGSAQVKVSTIALDSGFGDLSHFNRAFRRYFSLTPTDARALALNGVLSVND